MLQQPQQVVSGGRGGRGSGLGRLDKGVGAPVGEREGGSWGRFPDRGLSHGGFPPQIQDPFPPAIFQPPSALATTEVVASRSGMPLAPPSDPPAHSGLPWRHDQPRLPLLQPPLQGAVSPGLGVDPSLLTNRPSSPQPLPPPTLPPGPGMQPLVALNPTTSTVPLSSGFPRECQAMPLAGRGLGGNVDGDGDYIDAIDSAYHQYDPVAAYDYGDEDMDEEGD